MSRATISEAAKPLCAEIPKRGETSMSVDVMRVQNGRITDHWGVGNLLSLMQQIGGWTPPAEA